MMDAIPTTPMMTLALVKLLKAFVKDGIKGILNRSGDRKVSEILITSMILCLSSLRTSQVHYAFHTEGLFSVKTSCLMNSITKS